MNRLLHLGDCLDVLRGMADNSVDSIVTDPPYGLSKKPGVGGGFMGHKWDCDVPNTDIWAECLRVLKPGGHLLAFAGTRTQHRMAVRIEDAGFEIRDLIMWVYGCLDEQTQVATSEGVKPYHKTKVGDTVLCYNSEYGEYSYQPILEIVEYDYSDTAYRLVGDFGEQVVSRNHRCIIERDGKETFALAEEVARQQQARVPILESLPDLLQAVSGAEQSAGRSEQNVRPGLCQGDYRTSKQREESSHESAQREDGCVCGLRRASVEAGRLASEGDCANLQQGVQRQATRSGLGESRPQGASQLDTGICCGPKQTNDGGNKPGVEGRPDVSQQEGGVCQSTDQVCSLHRSNAEYGTQRRLRHGTSPEGGDGYRATIDADRVRASHQPQCNGQQPIELDAIQNQRLPQGIREWRGHKTALVRIEPFHYVGKVWCLRVPTGAFVAVRNGVAFPTGNSGFPKSHDISKAIDKAAGAQREVVGQGDNGIASGTGKHAGMLGAYGYGAEFNITVPSTDAAKQWQGWGTALKPAVEPITVARKPFGTTVAANVQEWGTGGINVDGCRVGANGESTARPDGKQRLHSGASGAAALGGSWHGSGNGISGGNPLGRWPANFIHDGSDDATGGLGSAARFFYCAKANKKDRDEGMPTAPAIMRQGARPGSADETGKFPDHDHRVRTGNHHPTVKPTDLMRYLCRLVTPPGGIVLDPFMGSGSTGKAAMREGFRFIGIERDPDYLAIAAARIDSAGPLL